MAMIQNGTEPAVRDDDATFRIVRVREQVSPYLEFSLWSANELVDEFSMHCPLSESAGEFREQSESFSRIHLANYQQSGRASSWRGREFA